MAVFAKYRPPNLWLKWDLVALTAMIANYIKPLGRIFPARGAFAATFRTALRRHHISLIKNFLLFFSKKKDLLTLNARCLYIRHFSYHLDLFFISDLPILTQRPPDQKHYFDNSDRCDLTVFPSVERL